MSTRVVILIAGGMLSDVYSDDPTLDVKLLDRDNIVADPEAEPWEQQVARETKGMKAVW